MRQRREDAKNIALIVGSGAMGFVTALLGAPLVRPHAEVEAPHPAPQFLELRVEPTLVTHPELRFEPTWRWVRETRQTRPGEFNTVYSLRMTPDGDYHFEASGLGRHWQSSELDRPTAMRLQAERVRERVREVQRARERASVENATRRAAEPIVYVDGVRVQGALTALDREGIESLEVVRGSQALEKYGKEGRNGVIVVTTKKPGKKRKDGGGR